MNYDCLEFKSSYDQEPHRLPEYYEARGELLRVFEAEGQTVAAFSWGAISLPGELLDELAALVGKECAVLRLDGRYYVRAVDGLA